METQTRVTLIGTFHFVSRLDMVAPEVIDMSTAPRQIEIERVVARLARYRPSKVLLEMPYAETARINLDYAQYRAGRRRLDPGEPEQIGFRLANALGHERVFPVDILHRWYEPSVEQVAARNRKAGELWAQLERDNAERSRRGTNDLKTRTVLELLAAMNTPEQQRSLGEYLTLFPRLVDGDDYAGADMTGNWYHRNIRIYANILRVTEPGDRLLIFYGSGHVPVLRHLLEASGEYIIDEAVPLLAEDV